jgi:photosystem II stability/assembly factor-like uncharacterized protein
LRVQLRALIFLLFALTASAQWKKLSVPTSAGLRGLSVVSNGVVWASGTDGTVIRTNDGGNHWSVMIVPGAEKLDFRGIHAFDEKKAVIISSGPAEQGQARIYRTTDGGATWKQVLEEERAGIFFDAVAFWDRKHGIVLSDPVDGKFVLFTTSDGGETWKQISPDALPLALPKEGAFAASNSCLTVNGIGDVWFASGGAEVARVFHSPDRGKTWTVVETPMHPANGSSGIFALAFQNANDGIAVGGDYAHPESSNLPNLLITDDGGKTWSASPPTDPVGVYLSSVAVLVARFEAVRYAVGTNGTFLLAAAHDYPVAHPDWGDLKLNSVAIAKASRPVVWAVGPGGTVATLGP